jgi:glycosyltransferase involved in cell wall biosynthesis
MSDGLVLDNLCVQEIKVPDSAETLPNLFLKKVLGRKRHRRWVERRTPYDRAKSAAKLVRKTDWFSGLQEMNPKLLHVHFGTDAEEAWPLAIALKIPMVVTLHGYDAAVYDSWWESGRGGKRFRSYPAAIRAMSEWGAQFIAVSDAIMSDANQRGIDSGSVRKILIGVDTSEVLPSASPIQRRRRRVLFVGRFVEKKGLEFLLRAFRDVKDIVADAELRIIGDGPLAPQLKALAEEIDVPAEFVGWKSEKEVLAEMHQARVLCVPSVRTASGDAEGLPTVIPEAQAAGLPVVTSARGGATEGIIDGLTGIAFPEGDLPALVRALAHVLGDDEFASTASLQARVFARDKLDITHQVGQLESFYDEISEGRPTFPSEQNSQGPVLEIGRPTQYQSSEYFDRGAGPDAVSSSSS